MAETADALVVLTTLENHEDGERLAGLLLESALAACVQILPPMTSIYRWQGAIERASEILLLIKTTRDAYPRVETVIKENHPYQTPEIIALPVAAGLADYLSWLRDSVKNPL
ncbi:MAG TPA: divalent-cation tolerance protein CutA [Blastocatellia bacterium]